MTPSGERGCLLPGVLTDSRGGRVLQLVARQLQEFNLYDPEQ